MVQRTLLFLLVACSVAALFLPIVTVQYPSGLTDEVGGAILLFYVLPGAAPHAASHAGDFLTFLGVAISAVVLLIAPLLPIFLRRLSNRASDTVTREAREATVAIIILAGVSVAGHAVLQSPYDLTRIYYILYGSVILTFAARATVATRVLKERSCDTPEEKG